MGFTLHSHFSFRKDIFFLKSRAENITHNKQFSWWMASFSDHGHIHEKVTILFLWCQKNYSVCTSLCLRADSIQNIQRTTSSPAYLEKFLLTQQTEFSVLGYHVYLYTIWICFFFLLAGVMWKNPTYTHMHIQSKSSHWMGNSYIW